MAARLRGTSRPSISSSSTLPSARGSQAASTVQTSIKPRRKSVAPAVPLASVRPLVSPKQANAVKIPKSVAIKPSKNPALKVAKNASTVAQGSTGKTQTATPLGATKRVSKAKSATAKDAPHLALKVKSAKVVTASKVKAPAAKTRVSKGKSVEVPVPAKKSRPAKTRPVVKAPLKTNPPAPVKTVKNTQAQLSLISETETPSLKRIRSKRNLVETYGENVARTPRTVETAKTKKARRDAAARERLKQLINPDEELLKRLARSGAIAPLSVGDDDEPKPRKSASSMVRRPRSWEFLCGKCRTQSTLKTQAGLCPKCGTIAVRFEWGRD